MPCSKALATQPLSIPCRISQATRVLYCQSLISRSVLVPGMICEHCEEVDSGRMEKGDKLREEATKVYEDRLRQVAEHDKSYAARWMLMAQEFGCYMPARRLIMAPSLRVHCEQWHLQYTSQEIQNRRANDPDSVTLVVAGDALKVTKLYQRLAQDPSRACHAAQIQQENRYMDGMGSDQDTWFQARDLATYEKQNLKALLQSDQLIIKDNQPDEVDGKNGQPKSHRNNFQTVRPATARRLPPSALTRPPLFAYCQESEVSNLVADHIGTGNDLDRTQSRESDEPVLSTRMQPMEILRSIACSEALQVELDSMLTDSGDSSDATIANSSPDDSVLISWGVKS